MARTGDFPDRVSALYHDAVESLRFYKQQQWSVTNYALLIYAAIFVLRSETILRTCEAKAILVLLVILTWLASAGVVSQLERRIRSVRRRVDKLHWGYFTPGEISALGLEPSPPQRNYWQHSIFVLLILVSTVGAVVSCLIVSSLSPARCFVRVEAPFLQN